MIKKTSNKSHIYLIESNGRKKNEFDFFEPSRLIRSQSEYRYLKETTKERFETVPSGVWRRCFPLYFYPIQSKENFIELEFMLETGEMITYPFRMDAGDKKYQQLLEALQVQDIEEALCKEIYVYLTPIPESGHRLLRIENIKAI